MIDNTNNYDLFDDIIDVNIDMNGDIKDDKTDRKMTPIILGVSQRVDEKKPYIINVDSKNVDTPGGGDEPSGYNVKNITLVF